MLKYSSVFFTGAATASLKFEQPGTQIFYTLNDNEPTEQNAIYEKSIQIKKSLTTLKAKAFGSGFIPSETIEATFIKDGLKIKSVQQTRADEKFPGNGPNTLIDNEGGIADLHNKNFLGYQKDSVEINLTLKKKQKIDFVLLNFLQDHDSWIFLPREIKVFYFIRKKNVFELMAKNEIAVNTITKRSSVFERVQSAGRIISDKLKIILIPLESLPAGHPGEGKRSWLFIDEIKIY